MLVDGTRTLDGDSAKICCNKHTRTLLREADSILTDAIPTDSITTDAIPTNAISTKIYVDRHVITLYIHIQQGATISRVMETVA